MNSMITRTRSQCRISGLNPLPNRYWESILSSSFFNMNHLKDQDQDAKQIKIQNNRSSTQLVHRIESNNRINQHQVQTYEKIKHLLDLSVDDSKTEQDEEVFSEFDDDGNDDEDGGNVELSSCSELPVQNGQVVTRSMTNTRQLMSIIENLNQPLNKSDNNRKESQSQNHKEQKPLKSRVPDDQLHILMKEYEKSTNWSKQQISNIAKKTGLTYSKVYKWNWDRRNTDYQQCLKQVFEKKHYQGHIFKVQDNHQRQEKKPAKLFQVNKVSQN
ncbi:UNKNOWN [Stylonychia lemnae]|uniref:Homeobox domain-containing protein n=1 Tax=Stylonychia lemnae TaxID=5949 RepID=A0A078B5Y2_STYLE|nr:UNKNOWN [Stylonychia lemnae]|eukprot:CDW89636.1 UNKNOWN [Stylonychia lemnae]